MQILRAFTGACLLAGASVVAFGGASKFESVKGLEWKLTPNARIEGNILTVDVPPGAGGGSASAAIDLSPYDGMGVEMTIESWGENLTKPPKFYLGYKFMLSYVDSATGKANYPGAPGREGAFPRRVEYLRDPVMCKGRTDGHLTLGLQQASGKVCFDLSTIRIRPIDTTRKVVNQDYKVKYPESVANGPQLRGAMLSSCPCQERDIADLAALGATLVRCQIVVPNAGDLAAYDKGLEVWLKALDERILPWAKKYGVRVVIDLHTTPGGRYKATGTDVRGLPNDNKIFFDKDCAHKFVEVWKRIAKRFAGRPEVYGYDLVNEPAHQAPPTVDNWTLQRITAEAIRAIDPVTPIIVEPDSSNNPNGLETLSPLAMDNVIYSFHMYRPHEFTHQGVIGDKEWKNPQPYPNAEKGWDREFLRKGMESVIAFQKRHNAKIYVGEFSAIAWAEGADRYLADVISLFREYGWDWTYHAWREYEGWSVEHEWKHPVKEKPVPSTDNPRMRVLKAGFKGEALLVQPKVADNQPVFKRVLISGNSLTRHPPLAKIGWTNDWGMAASRAEKDYVHLLLKEIEHRGGGKPDCRLVSMPLENGLKDSAKLDAICAENIKWKPDLVIFAHGENAHALTNEVNWAVCKASYLQAAKAFKAAGATVVLRTPFWPSDRYAKMLKDVAADTGAIWVDIGDLGWKEGMSATGLFEHKGVAMHPGDAGMRAIADRFVKAIYARSRNAEHSPALLGK